ncbi:CopY/TcrY family copper transport repressor [Limosilactobacillus caecicola]|uniref:CopY/TcrY family copper transport repressor n=1 Tax=Limosilactobacillus caecicola TaxID=2941332 RepID=UPI00203DDC59|nr:CopY/TcrY family copper transport repressor [Limosilactobacillus caecicola]
MTDKLEISPAEWQVMRIAWTLQRVTSSQVIEILQRKVDWKPATIKTLLRRLVQKKVLKTTKQGRSFIYEPIVQEQPTMDIAADQLFSSICEMHVGSTLAHVLENHQLSQQDIKTLQQLLKVKAITAPETVDCNCVPGEARCAE